jgi:hypothetical protein
MKEGGEVEDHDEQQQEWKGEQQKNGDEQEDPRVNERRWAIIGKSGELVHKRGLAFV